jgi:hypothetical protein
MRISPVPELLENLLRNNTFILPEHQRAYAWDLVQIHQLIEDLNTQPKGYNLNKIEIFEKDKANHILQVCDGQQRLTTISLILFCIKKLLKDTNNQQAIEIINPLIYQRLKTAKKAINGNEPRIILGPEDNHLYRTILNGGDYRECMNKRKYSHLSLVEAIEIGIKVELEEIMNKNGIDGILDLLDKITECTAVVCTLETTEDLTVYYASTNSRGKPLTDSEMIKNLICANTKVISSAVAMEMWKEIKELLENAGRSALDFDEFLFYYINSLPDAAELRKHLDYGNTFTKSFPPVPYQFVLRVYEAKLKKIVNTQDFLAQMKTSARNYIEIQQPALDKPYLNGLFILGNKKCASLLLVGKKVLNDNNFKLLCKAVEAVSFRQFFIREKPHLLESMFYDLIPHLNTDADIDNIIAAIKQHPSMLAIDKFQTAFLYMDVSTVRIQKLILSRIIGFEQESIDCNRKNIWLEHVLPRKPKGEWKILYDENPDLYYENYHKFGNLTFIQDIKNINMSNRDFNAKKEIYKTSSIRQTNKLVDYDHWGYDTISQRQIELFEIVNKVWSI